MTLTERIARAIALLQSNGYRVTLLRPAHRPKGTGRRVDREKAKSLANEGLAVPQIAAELGCADSTVYAILNGTR